MFKVLYVALREHHKVLSLLHINGSFKELYQYSITLYATLQDKVKMRKIWSKALRNFTLFFKVVQICYFVLCILDTISEPPSEIEPQNDPVYGSDTSWQNVGTCGQGLSKYKSQHCLIRRIQKNPT